EPITRSRPIPARTTAAGRRSDRRSLTPGLRAIAQEFLARHDAVAVGVDPLEASGRAGVPLGARDDAGVVAVEAIEARRPVGRIGARVRGGELGARHAAVAVGIERAEAVAAVVEERAQRDLAGVARIQLVEHARAG